MSKPDGHIPSEAPALLPAWEGRAILLVDLDAFFASVEQLDHPGWRGKPVIVGGSPDKRGVVSTASYEARAFGVHSAMPSSQAARLCPQAVWTRGRYERYREVSNAVMSILHDETPFVQQVSIDEAFLDVSPTAVNREHPVAIAQRIQQRVAKLGITCSVGVGTSKTVAKIASDMDKPRGLTVVFPGTERDFLGPLPVRKLSGIGKASEERLVRAGIHTLGELAQAGQERLERLFGKNGVTMYLRACGLDDTPVAEDDEVKSVSNETSFAHDLTQRDDIMAAVRSMAAKVGRRLRKKGLAGHTLTLKVKFASFRSRTNSVQISPEECETFAMVERLAPMLDELWRPGMAVRLVGVAVSGFDKAAGSVQESLFDADGEPTFAQESADRTNSAKGSIRPSSKGEDRRAMLLRATDCLKDRYGEDAVRFGHEIRSAENTTGTTAKNPADYK